MTDWVDRAQLVTERAREISVRSVQRVARALEAERLSRLCCDCAEPVEADRLQACPGAGRCLHCQEAHERFLRSHAVR
jgi:RNA polymerase-binding transcription factor DksA